MAAVGARASAGRPGCILGQPVARVDAEHVGLGTATVPDMHTALPQQLGRFPFWQGEQELIPALRDIYENASQSALDVYLGQEPGGDAEANRGREFDKALEILERT